MAEHFYEPARGHGLAHDPLKAIVAPRPIGWISTLSEHGVPNLAPYSYFALLSAAPPLIGFSSEGWKDTVANIRATGEFCWNLATRRLAEQVNATSAPLRPEEDEFGWAGLTPAASRLVAAPRVAQAPVSFECRLADLHQLRSADGASLAAWFTIGEVVGVHIDQTLLPEGRYVTSAAQPVMRGGGPADWFGVTEAERFELHRPVVEEN